MFPELTLDEYDERLQCAKADGQYEDYTVREVVTRDEGYDVSFRESTSLFVPRALSKVRPPAEGDVLRLFGRGFGAPVRGIALMDLGTMSGLYRYRTTDECSGDLKAAQATEDDKRRRAWEENKLDTIAEIQNLPDAFQKRFYFFMRNADWAWQFGRYEAWTMIEAWKIYRAVRDRHPTLVKLSDVIAPLVELPGRELRTIVPDLDEDISGNGLGCAVGLAHALAIRTEEGAKQPELYQYHGAMCPIVGCKDYGCYSTTADARGAAAVAKKEWPQIEYTAAERDRMLSEMERAATAFYNTACRIGHHPFVEIAGLMNETIKMWKGMHVDGIDFGTSVLRAKPYHLQYIAEKIDCIWGPAIAASEENRNAFLDALAEKGGWPR